MKKVLFLSHRVPFPPRKGDKIRSYQELRFLSGFYQVDLVSFFDRSDDAFAEVELKRFCRQMHLFELQKGPAALRGGASLLRGRSYSQGYFWPAEARKKIADLLERNHYSFVFCFSSQTAPAVLKAHPCKVMDLCDVDSEKFRQFGGVSGFPMRLIYRLESRRLARLEKQIAGDFDAVLLSTQAELDLFSSQAPLSRGIVLRNGVDHNYFRPVNAFKEDALVFTGEMDYFANVDAVVWFCNDVLPSLLPHMPNLRFYIVGRRPVKQVRDLARRFPGNVVVTGAVFDVRPYIARSKLAVVPVRVARGIQNKVLEAMAMSTPVLVNRRLAAAFDGLDESLLFSFENARECADAIRSLLRSDSLLARTGAALRDYVIANHDWNKILRSSTAWETADPEFWTSRTRIPFQNERAAA